MCDNNVVLFSKPRDLVNKRRCKWLDDAQSVVDVFEVSKINELQIEKIHLLWLCKYINKIGIFEHFYMQVLFKNKV